MIELKEKWCAELLRGAWIEPRFILLALNEVTGSERGQKESGRPEIWRGKNGKLSLSKPEGFIYSHDSG